MTTALSFADRIQAKRAIVEALPEGKLVCPVCLTLDTAININPPGTFDERCGACFELMATRGQLLRDYAQALAWAAL